MAIDAQLDTLESKGLIRVAAYQPELEYLFRHALVQDAAYESLLRQERRTLHRVVAESLERLYPDRRDELAAVLTMHFGLAGDADRAIPYAMEAARYALDRNAIVEAFGLYEQAAELLPAPSPDEDDALRRRRVEIGLGMAKAGFTFRSPKQGLATLEPLLADAERLGDLRLVADIQLHIALLRQGRGERRENSPQLLRALERVEQIGEQLHDPSIGALPRALIGTIQVFTGEMREGLAALEEAVPVLQERHDFVGASFALGIRAIGYARLGDFETAEQAAHEATQVAADGDLIAQLDALIAESMVRSLRGDLAGAVPLAQRCTTWSEETGATACVVVSNFVLGDAYMRQGRFEDAKLALERGKEVSALTESPMRPSIGAWLRATAVHLGDLDPASEGWEKELEGARDLGDHFSEAAILAKRAETRVKALGDGSSEAELDAIDRDYAASTAAFETMGARPYLARALRGWGETLRARGRRDEGDEKLRRALALFDEMGIVGEAAEVRGLLSGVTPLVYVDQAGPGQAPDRAAG